MNFTCSICAELFRNSDAIHLRVTRCGHLFHNACLSQWLERKNSCPECRSKETQRTVIKLYVNVADGSYFENQSDAPDLVTLQSENDHLKFRILEKDGQMKSKDELNEKLDGENKKLKDSQVKSRNVILSLEQKIDQQHILSSVQTHQIKNLTSRISEIEQLKEKLKEANDKNRLSDLVQQVINGSQQEIDSLLREGRSTTELAAMVTTLKQELRKSSTKRAQIRANVDDLSKQLRHCKLEKSQLEDKLSVLESKLFQLESCSKNDSKNDSTENVENEKDTSFPKVLSKRKFDNKLLLPTFNFHSELVQRTKSPSLNVKASSIAGLSPLLKRTKSAESYKLSPINNDQQNGVISILKRPRLLQTHAKKSDLRPQRLQMGSQSARTAESTHDHQNVPSILRKPTLHTNQEQPSTSIFANNRFRLGPLPKMQ